MKNTAFIVAALLASTGFAYAGSDNYGSEKPHATTTVTDSMTTASTTASTAAPTTAWTIANPVEQSSNRPMPPLEYGQGIWGK